MKVIAVANQKGGCGKTITAVNLAGTIAGAGKSVLFIDLDPQAHATSAFGIKTPEPLKSSYAIFDAFLRQNTIDLTSLLQRKYNSLWVIGSSISLSTMEQKMSGMTDALLVLSRALTSYELPKFDYAIVDTPPNLGFLTLNSILAANRLIVPLDTSVFSLNGIKQMYEILKISENMNFKKPEINFLITLFDGRSNFSRDFLKKAKDLFGDRLLSTVIRSNVKLREAALSGKVIFEYAPYANGAKDYANMAWEIAPEIREIPLTLKSVLSDSRTSQTMFKFYSPEAQHVHLVGTFNDWAVDESTLMKKLDNGMWIKTIPLPEGNYHYKFVVNNEWKEDPTNNLLENDMFGGRNSVILVKAA